jgi:cobyrinic acid a,c-diamide synthase
VVAAPSSGSGKTGFTLGLLAALAKKGIDARPFKIGPDYLDTALHAAVAGGPSLNLDPLLMGKEAVVASLARGGEGGFAVIEGVMGLFDGSGLGASTADVACLVEAPVLLLVDASASAESAGAMALGFSTYRRDLRVAGVVLNRVAGKAHYEAARTSIIEATGLPVYGFLPNDGRFNLPERHLGLVGPGEAPGFVQAVEAIAASLSANVDLDAILAVAASAPELRPHAPRGRPAQEVRPAVGPTRVAVARDKAFSFLYEDNLRALRDAGLEPVFFSPLADEALPEAVSGLWLCGGYPELHASRLSRNTRMRASIRAAAEAGLPTFAECGGYLYLLESFPDTEGGTWEGCALLPGRGMMGDRLEALGYREGRILAPSVLGPAGTLLKGHVFHFSRVEGGTGDLALRALAPAAEDEARPEGYCRGSVFASFLHLHFDGNPIALANFAEACRRHAASSG